MILRFVSDEVFLTHNIFFSSSVRIIFRESSLYALLSQWPDSSSSSCSIAKEWAKFSVLFSLKSFTRKLISFASKTFRGRLECCTDREREWVNRIRWAETKLKLILIFAWDSYKRKRTEKVEGNSANFLFSFRSWLGEIRHNSSFQWQLNRREERVGEWRTGTTARFSPLWCWELRERLKIVWSNS